MRTWKKILSVALVVVLTLSLVACGDSPDSGSTGGSSSSGDTVKIGWMSDQSGDNALSSNVAAFNLAVSEINAAGGILGKQIEVVNVDGQSNTSRYQQLCKQLILEKGVVAVFQDGISSNREAIRPTCEENKTLLMYPNFYEGGVASRYTMCTGAGPEQTILPLLQYIKDNNIGSSVYIIAADYNYGQISAQWIEEYCDQLGFKKAGTEFIPLGTSQFSSSISKIEESGADIVFTLLVGSAQMSFFSQWISADVKGVKLVSTNNIAYSYEQKKVEAPGLSGMLACATFFEDMTTDAAKKFVADFYKEYPNEECITNQSETAYTSLYLYKAAVEKAGTFETEAVINAFESDEISVDAPSGKVVVDGATHHAKLTVTIVEVQDDHFLKTIATIPDMAPTYLKDLGVDIRKEDPHTQFSPLADGIKK